MIMKTVRIRLLWHKQAQFAGYLLAESLGLARHAGIDIVCEGLDFACKHVEAVLTGQSEMAVASPAHLLESRSPERLRWLLAIQQKSPLVYPARRSDGIAELGDLAGRKVGVWPGHEDLELRWMLSKAGLPAEAVTRVEMPDTVKPFLAGETASGQMTNYHELHQVEETVAKDDLVLFEAAPYGATILKDGLIADAGLCEDEPALVQAVVDAVLQGWTLAFTEPQRALEACCAARPDMSHAEQARQLQAIRELSLTGATLSQGLGYPDPDHMAKAATALAEVGETAPSTVGLADPGFWHNAPAEFRRSDWPVAR